MLLCYFVRITQMVIFLLELLYYCVLNYPGGNIVLLELLYYCIRITQVVISYKNYCVSNYPDGNICYFIYCVCYFVF